MLKVVFEFKKVLIKHTIETENTVAHCGIDKMITLFDKDIMEFLKHTQVNI